MAAPWAEAAACDPRLKAVTQRPGRRRDRIDRAAKARRAEPEAIGPAIDLQMREHQRVDLLKVARSVGRVHRCTVDQQRHAAKVEAAADARSPDREPRLLAIEIGRASCRERVCQYV